MKVDDNLTKSSKEDDKQVEKDDKKVKKDDEKIEEVEKSDEKIPKGMIELKFQPFQTMIILGKRNTGKSYLTKYLIHQLVNQGLCDTVYLFSTTERYSHSFNCLEKEYIVDGFDIKFIQSIIDAQRKRIDRYGLKSEKIAKIMMVFDDLVGSLSSSSKEMQMLTYLFATSRHIGISLVVCAQASRSLISPTLKNNCDWLMWRNLNEDYTKSLYEAIYWNQSGGMNSFLEFTKKSLMNTKYEFLCYNNTIDDASKKWSLVLAEEVDFMLNMRIKRKVKDDKKKEKPKNI